jgi:hypothetical protein
MRSICCFILKRPYQGNPFKDKMKLLKLCGPAADQQRTILQVNQYNSVPKHSESIDLSFLNIKEPAKFTTKTLADLSMQHGGSMIGLGITEPQLNQWIEETP